MGTALRQAFLDVDKNMRAHFRMQANPGERSGCTAIAVCITPTHVVTANAGDSRGLLARRGDNVVSGNPRPDTTATGMFYNLVHAHVLRRSA